MKTKRFSLFLIFLHFSLSSCMPGIESDITATTFSITPGKPPLSQTAEVTLQSSQNSETTPNVEIVVSKTPTNKPAKENTPEPSLTPTEFEIPQNLCQTTSIYDFQNNMAFTSESDPSSLEGQIFVWDYGYPSSSYLRFDPTVNIENNFTFVKSPDTSIKNPEKGVALGFSNYSQNIAYLTIVENIIELWVADLSINHADCVWSDSNEWLGNISYDEDIQVKWGPGDKFVILNSLLNEQHSTIIRLENGNSASINGGCNQIAYSEDIADWVVVCSDIENSTSLGLEPEGNIVDLSSPSSLQIGEPISVVDWSISPDNKKILFATEQLDVLLGDEAGNIMSLPIGYVPKKCCGLEAPRRSLQWSQDGNQILVFGSEPDREAGRWYVLNPSNSQIVWTQDVGAIIEQAGYSLPALNLNYDAMLSPNGAWIVASYSYSSVRFFAVTSILTNETKIVGEFVAPYSFWSP